jgi:hypothetical protein
MDRRRVIIALAVAAGLAVLYILYKRSSSAASSSGSPDTGSQGSTVPAAGNDAGGSGGGAGASPDDTSALLSSLAGENQDLLKQLLAQPFMIPAPSYGAPYGGGDVVTPESPAAPVASTTTGGGTLNPANFPTSSAPVATFASSSATSGGQVAAVPVVEGQQIVAEPTGALGGQGFVHVAQTLPPAPAPTVAPRPAGTGGRVIQHQVAARSL